MATVRTGSYFVCDLRRRFILKFRARPSRGSGLWKVGKYIFLPTISSLMRRTSANQIVLFRENRILYKWTIFAELMKLLASRRNLLHGSDRVEIIFVRDFAPRFFSTRGLSQQICDRAQEKDVKCSNKL